MTTSSLVKSVLTAGIGVGILVAGFAVNASSHREAPLITKQPKLDGTDFYMFNSYEPGREDFVTLIANYLPLQDSYGGPNYFTLDPHALYDIHIDNNGDAKPDLTFRFKFRNIRRNISLNIGGKQVPIPLRNSGPIGPEVSDTQNLNEREIYSVQVIKNSKKSLGVLRNINTGSAKFVKPVDNIGQKSIPEYARYASNHIYTVQIPGCGTGRLFVGQRKEGFAINLGEVFDLVNTNPLGPVDGERNILENKNITSLALEIPKQCLTKANKPTIAAWTTATEKQIFKVKTPFGVYRYSHKKQRSRLGNPLVNELVIGLKDKNSFNRSRPSQDARFAVYVTNPTVPALLQSLFNVQAPSNIPRTDLVAAFLTGINGVNKTTATAEMLRLNTSIAPIQSSLQNSLGVIGGDAAGYPNGRRPGDDVVDIVLRVAMGRLCHPVTLGGKQIDLGLCNPSDAPVGLAPLTDGALVKASDFDQQFPYLTTPVPGSPAN